MYRAKDSNLYCGKSTYCAIVSWDCPGDSGVNAKVRFQQSSHSIEVRGIDGAPSFDATLTLNGDGECRVRIGGEEYELWRMRQMALEKIFFEPPRRSTSQM